MRVAIAACVILAAAANVARADEPRAQWSTDDKPHAGVPFDLQLHVDGLDESPAPAQPTLSIPGATVRALGAEPNTSRSISIINGRRSDFTRTEWVFHWQVTVAKEGALHVPTTTITQGGKHATAPGADAEVEAIATTDTMKLELALPDRPVFVGENIPVTLTWLFRAEPARNPTFQVPMLDGESFTIGTVPATNQKTYKFAGGDKTLDLPFTVDDTDVGGVGYHRLRATFYAAPKKTGKIEVPAASVVVALATGRSDFFGNAPSKLFRASDAPRTLEVKPLPETDRPPGFAGAVGTQFSITVATSRSVVQLGEPVELAITIKSDQRLDTLSLGRLDGPGGLPKDKFTVPAEPPTGELSDDGKTKTFKVTAQVIGPATEVPALALAYFDPVKGAYQVVHGDPIALSVKGGTMVSASDVVAATPAKPATTAAASNDADLALVGADLALSAPGETESQPLGGAMLWLVVALLYLAPLAVFGARHWQLRTRASREDAAEVRAARRRVEHELARAAKDPARDVAGPLAAALRELARTLAVSASDELFARLEIESFAPAAASSPLAADVRVRAEELARKWTTAAKKRPKRGAAAAVALVAIVLAPQAARAAPSADEARALYQDAIAITDASARRAKLQTAAAAFGEAARAEPDRPELLADWGTAALAAGDLATATLAYRRALAIDGGNTRARKNLAWLRGRAPEALRPPSGSAADALFFFHHWPRARRLVVGGIAFALAILLLVPWGERRRRALTGLAVLPLAIWLAMVGSLVLEDSHAKDAVVMNAAVLRAADSAGAPAAMAQPLPRGTEVTVLEQRDAWTRVRVATGTAGWVEAGNVERVSP
ncbi:MAG TPA: hypothetical protein VMJ10_18230 [Kofleriaceae bacterium]|nr:hypothetical protein [Kofleriaceae bacterium]